MGFVGIFYVRVGTSWVQNIYLRLDTVVLLPNFEIAFAHISVKGSPIAAL